MSRVRVDFVHAGTAEFVIDYGEKRARIKLEGLGTTGGPEEDSMPWEPYYRKCMEELFAAIQANDTDWKFSGSE